MSVVISLYSHFGPVHLVLPVVIVDLRGCCLVHWGDRNSINELLLVLIEHLVCRSILAHESGVDAEGPDKSKGSKGYLGSHNLLDFNDNTSRSYIPYILIIMESNNLFTDLVISYYW